MVSFSCKKNLKYYLSSQIGFPITKYSRDGIDSIWHLTSTLTLSLSMFIKKKKGKKRFIIGRSDGIIVSRDEYWWWLWRTFHIQPSIRRRMRSCKGTHMYKMVGRNRLLLFFMVHILLVFDTWTYIRKWLQPINAAMASSSMWMFNIHSIVLSSLRLLFTCKSTYNREREIKKKYMREILMYKCDEMIR
jgi:hypothetical protein